MNGHVIPVEALYAMAGAIGAVPGCRLMQEQQWRGMVTNTGEQRFAITVHGRSPSLHETQMEWELEIDTRLSGDAVAAQALDALSKRIALQRERAEAGLALGRALPLHMNHGYAGMDQIEVGHLSMDASALAFRLAELPSGSGHADVLGMLAAPVRQVHLKASKSDGGRSVRHDGTVIWDTRGERLIDLTTLVPDGEGSPYIASFLTGRRFHLDDVTVPDTALAAMGGRRLDALARVHPLLDARIVATAANTLSKKGQPRIAVTLSPLYVPIGDIVGLARRGQTSREIVARLRAFIGEASPDTTFHDAQYDEDKT